MTDFAALLQPDRGQTARTLHVVTPADWLDWLGRQTPRVRTMLSAQMLTGMAGDAAILPGETAEDWSALLVCDEPLSSPWRIASRGSGVRILRVSWTAMIEKPPGTGMGSLTAPAGI